MARDARDEICTLNVCVSRKRRVKRWPSGKRSIRAATPEVAAIMGRTRDKRHDR